eukprot:CAMPEP_0114133204 /NCGR_PEP_ID=MMETSP0043_2-20121206/13500_1 /TAXON_ID=464988 /ORGANISM="Hemiselmis andersenii, Strain CCMP644" /LENGTH=166 /DNA_ID=CAMNT_0001226763 /DNA_START=7 /DNA_END=507 /DNA_ORIENTATION=+
MTIWVITNAVSIASIGGLSGADALCTADAIGNVASKALLAGEGGGGRSGLVGSQIDWPLKPNTEYWSKDESRLVTVTNGDSVIPNPMLGLIQTVSNFNQASGFNADWSPKVGETCTSWTSGNSFETLAVGWLCTDVNTVACLEPSSLLVGGTGNCGESKKFLCVTV